MTSVLFDKLAVLSAPQQQVLLDFAEYLVRKYGKTPIEKKRKRTAGTLKGLLIHMDDDFNGFQGVHVIAIVLQHSYGRPHGNLWHIAQAIQDNSENQQLPNPK